jgi:hypothetical protein
MMFFVYSAFHCSNLMTITLGDNVEHVPWRPSLAWFTPIRGGGRELVSTGRPQVVEVIRLQSGAEVTMAAPFPLTVGKENKIVAPESQSGGAYSSPTWSELEEDEGVTLASTNVVADAGCEEAQGQADKRLAQASGPSAQQAALGGS